MSRRGGGYDLKIEHGREEEASRKSSHQLYIRCTYQWLLSLNLDHLLVYRVMEAITAVHALLDVLNRKGSMLRYT